MSYIQTRSGLLMPASFAEAPLKAPEMREVATTQDGRDITRGYVDPMMLLAPQDTVLAARGGNYEIYREVLRDDQVKAVFDQRRLAVVSREWEVVPGGKKRIDKKAADSLREQLNEIKWDSVTDKMLYGVFYGYAVAECLYARDGAEIVLNELRVRDRRRFGFDGAGRLRLQTMSSMNPGEELKPRKFWHFCTGADHDDEPYGLGLAHWLYWPVLFKRNNIKFWLIFLEKFGQPTAKGTYPTNATATEKQRLLAALEAIQTDAALIIPEGMTAELIEAARSGTADYVAMFSGMNATIAKVVLGQTLTTEAVGGQYKADVQMDVRQDLVKADADLVCMSFNFTVARWLTEWNYPGAEPPQVWRRLDEDEDLGDRAQRDKTIADIGFRPSVKYITDTYGGEWTESSPPPAVPGGPAPGEPGGPPPGPAFADPGEDPTPIDALTDRMAEEAAPALKDLLDQVRLYAEAAESMEQLRDWLLAAYGELDTAALTQVMALGFAAADLAGRADVTDETGLNRP